MAKRNYKKKSRKITPRRRKNYRTNLAVGGPRSMMVKLRYIDNFQLDPGVATPVGRVYRWNNTYDPYTPAGGQQFRKRDELMGVEGGAGLFKRLQVLGAKATFQIITTDGSNPCKISVLTSTDVSTLTSDRDISEHSNCTNRLLSKSAGGHDYATIVKKWSAKKHFGRNYMDTEYSEGPSSGPTDADHEAYLHIYASYPWGSSDVTKINVSMTIDAICLLTEPTVAGGS